MIRRKVHHFGLILTMTFLILALLGQTMTVVFASTNDELKATAEGEASFSSIINTIEENVYIDDNNIKLENPTELLEKLTQADIDNLNDLAISQGLKGDFTKESLIKTFTQEINNLNKKVQINKLDVLEDGSMIDSSDESFYVQGGSTYDKTFWWGQTRYKSTSAANTWVYELNKSANANAAGAILAGIVFGPGAAVPNGLTGIYCSTLANSISHQNSKNNRGVIVDIAWVLTYKVFSQ